MKTAEEYIEERYFYKHRLKPSKEELLRLVGQVMNDTVEAARLVAFNFDVEGYHLKHGLKYIGVKIAEEILLLKTEKEKDK